LASLLAMSVKGEGIAQHACRVGSRGESGSRKLQQRQAAASDSPCTDRVAGLSHELALVFSQNLQELGNRATREDLLLLASYS